MAHFFENKDRHVIPNWRSFDNTARLGELNGSKGTSMLSSFKPDISDLISDWQYAEEYTIGLAGDVLGGAKIANQIDSPIIRSVAEFVIKNKNISPKYLVEVANEILRPAETRGNKLELDVESVDSFLENGNKVLLINKIHSLKLKLRENPRNAINWIEIGRIYAILGQDVQARRSVKNALFLAPENRFILRSMSRFFVHSGQEGVEFAHDVIRKSELVKADPWVLATEISLATLRDRNSRNTSSGFQIASSNSLHPFNTSELTSALATLELKNDKLKNSRKLFQQSLIAPNDNSLAQAEWASTQTNRLSGIIPPSVSINSSFEALARDAAEKSEWKKAINYCKQWFLDMPFSKGSILFGNHIALDYLRDHETAIEIARLGLLSHPNDPHILNNIIYSLCMLNQIDEAAVVLKKVRKEDWLSGTIHNACLLATLGLYHYRLNDIRTARRCYENAIMIAKNLDKTTLIHYAMVNMIREEVHAKTELVEDLLRTLAVIRDSTDDPNLLTEIKEIFDLRVAE